MSNQHNVIMTKDFAVPSKVLDVKFEGLARIPLTTFRTRHLGQFHVKDWFTSNSNYRPRDMFVVQDVRISVGHLLAVPHSISSAFVTPIQCLPKYSPQTRNASLNNFCSQTKPTLKQPLKSQSSRSISPFPNV